MRLMVLGMVWGILTGFTGGLTGLRAQNPWKSSLRAEMEVSGALGVRWVLESKDSQFLYWETREREKSPRRAVGLGSPFVSVGQVDPTGLIREADNPLGYTANSGVFGETTGLSLYRGMEIKNRWGVLLSGPERIVSIGGYQEKGEEPFVFTSFNVLSPDPHRAEKFRFTGTSFQGFLSLTEKGAGQIPLEWFPPKREVLPGPLSHWGYRGKVGIEGPVWGSVVVSAVGSNPAHEGPGLLTHLHASFFTSWAEAKVLLGYCSPAYVTPSGSRTSKESQAGMGMEIRPWGPFFLSIDGMEHGHRDRGAERDLRFEGGTKGKNHKLSYQLESAPSGERNTLEGWGRWGPLSLQLSAGWEPKRPSSSPSLSLRGAYASSGWETELWFQDLLRDKVRGGLTFSVKSHRWKLGITGEIKRPLGFSETEKGKVAQDPLSYFGVTLFFSAWESHLPMKRISGSKGLP